MKEEFLGVGRALIEQHTAVSDECARAMAEGARARTHSTYAVATTGEAGPTSNSGVPVGTVFLGFAGPKGSGARKLTYPPDRSRVRAFTAQAAIDEVRKLIVSS